MSAPPFPPQPSYSSVPPPPPPAAPTSTYYNAYQPYPNYPPPQPYESYPPPPPPPPPYEQNQPHHPHPHTHHNHNQAPSAPRIMYPRPMYSLPAKISNAIYVKSLPYTLSVNEFMPIFSQFGEIATTFTNKISTRGFAFVTYYDIRSAINAVDQMKDQKIHDRQPVVTFSFNPPEYSRLNAHETSSMVLIKPIDNNTNNIPSIENQAPTETATQPSDQQQSSAFNSFFGTSQAASLDVDSVAKSLSSIGDIFKTTELGQNQFVVQFYDFRKAQEAIANANNININGQRVTIESYVEPDEGVYYENPPQYPPQPPQMPISPGMPRYPPPYPPGNNPHHHGNNGSGNRNNRNNRINNHANRHGNRPQQPKHQQPFQQPPLPPPPYMPTQPPQLPPQVPQQPQQPQQPGMPPSMPPQYPIPPQGQFQQGVPPPPQMQYMMQYPQGTQPPPPPPPPPPSQQSQQPIQPITQ